MLQIIGGGLLLGSFSYFGHYLAGLEGRRVRQMEGFLLLVRHVRTGIVCFAEPMEEIYRRFENEALETCGFLPALREGGFASALHVCRDRLYIGAEEGRALAAFAREVGKSYSREQAAVCDYTIGELEAALRRHQEEAPRRARAARSLAVCGGLALLILLL
ncbi:MAG: hypothetical protein IJY20_03810 [Clostridia bacterium]|nr:hypothetical protein [Clostridia bacterium]